MHYIQQWFHGSIWPGSKNLIICMWWFDRFVEDSSDIQSYNNECQNHSGVIIRMQVLTTKWKQYGHILKRHFRVYNRLYRQFRTWLTRLYIRLSLLSLRNMHECVKLPLKEYNKRDRYLMYYVCCRGQKIRASIVQQYATCWTSYIKRSFQWIEWNKYPDYTEPLRPEK